MRQTVHLHNGIVLVGIRAGSHQDAFVQLVSLILLRSLFLCLSLSLCLRLCISTAATTDIHIYYWLSILMPTHPSILVLDESTQKLCPSFCRLKNKISIFCRADFNYFVMHMKFIKNNSFSAFKAQNKEWNLRHSC